MRLPLKNFQREALDVIARYCAGIRQGLARENPRPERLAYEAITERDYYTPPGFEGVPYVCIRIPTGGGKTLLAAHAVGTIGDKLLGTDRPVCLWIAPSTTIRDQTLRGLQKQHHPLRLALQDSLASDVEVLTLEDALLRPRAIQSRAALVIVTTIQSYRIDEETTAPRKIYEDNGYLQVDFHDVPEWARSRLAHDDNGLVNLSLANAILLRRPIVVMDEAHNARTPVSFASLARFAPSFVLELTATPEQLHEPNNASKPRFASNVLHACNALELKNEGMIKLPVDLESREDWLEVLAATVQRRNELETVADRATEDPGLPFLRPIALIQAQPKHKTKETHTVEAVKDALITRLEVPEHEIRICTGSLDEIGDTDLMAGDCPIRYIITVDKLREGWDCPLAHVLGSIGNASTPTAVEQLIGRILRMPNANPTRVPALDRAYAFVLSKNVVQTAMELRDRMVQKCGFDERSAEEALRVCARQAQRGLGFGRIHVSCPLEPEKLPPEIASKVRYDAEQGTIVVDGSLNQSEAQALRDSVDDADDKQAIEDFWQQERPLGIAPKSLDSFAKPFFVPRLAVDVGGRLTLFEPVELETFAWDLDACDPVLSEHEFSSDIRVGSAATIDVRGDEAGRAGLVTEATGDVRLKQLELIGEGDDWAQRELVLWLDRALHQDDSFMGLPLSESQPWINRVVESLVTDRRIELPMIVRRRHRLADVIRVKASDHGRKQTRKATNQLLDTRPQAVTTSAEFCARIEEQDYAPSQLEPDTHIFKKHAFDLIGSTQNKEERLCGIEIDRHENVERWIRNPSYASQGGFSLPKSPGRFFPDFIVELKSGKTVIVEYKNSTLAADPEEQHKRAVGELWAERSDGQCRFAYVIDRDWASLAAKLECL